MLEHVLCIPVTCMAGPGGIADRQVDLVCSCSGMASTMESIVGRQTAYAGVPLTDEMDPCPVCLLYYSLYFDVEVLLMQSVMHIQSHDVMPVLAEDRAVEEAGWLAALSDHDVYQRISDVEVDRSYGCHL